MRLVGPNPLPAGCEFCLANSLDPDQDVMPGLGPSCLTPWCYALKIIFDKDKSKVEKYLQTQTFISMQRVIPFKFSGILTIVIVCVHRGNQ